MNQLPSLPGMPPLVEYRGTLHETMPVVQPSERFRKREFVLAVTPRHAKEPELIKFELLQDRVGDIDLFQKGDPLLVQFVVRGRFFASPTSPRYYVHLEVVQVVPDRYGKAA